MNLHKTELGWTTYCIISDTGHPSNFHHTDDGLLDRRVTPDDATRAIVVEVEKIDGELKITSTEVIEL